MCKVHGLSARIVVLVAWNVGTACVKTDWSDSVRVHVNVFVIFTTPALKRFKFLVNDKSYTYIIMEVQQWFATLCCNLELDYCLAPDILGV